MRITVITQHLSASDLNYTVLKELTKMKGLGHEVCWMYENDCTPFIDIRLPRMSIGKMWEDQSVDGYIIATSIASAEIIQDLPNKKQKLFYVWNPEFLYSKKDYLSNLKAFNLPVYTRSESYQKLIYNYANKETVLQPFDLERICQ